VLTTCQPSTVWCSRERLPAAAAQPVKVRQSCSATDYYYIIIRGTLSYTYKTHTNWKIIRDEWWRRQYVPLKRRSTIILHGSTYHKTILNYVRYVLPPSSGMSDDGGSMYLWNVGRQLFYTAVHPRRQFWTSYSAPWELEISQTLHNLYLSRIWRHSSDQYI
jgi:hypothetical protein